MNLILAVSITCMFSALVLYSTGVWGEQRAGILQRRHVLLFWAGLVFDTTGTSLMSRMAGKFQLNFHTLTGGLAILLMLVHAVWATLALAGRNQTTLKHFHRFSVSVWALWLLPFITGLVAAMLPR